MMPPRVLLVGYNGANNTGAEALLLADLADVRAVFGEAAHVTVPTLNEGNLRRYLHETPFLRIAGIPPVYVRAFRRLVREHDLILLVEGSSYMDSWTSALLWAYLWVTRCAHAMGKPCLAYAVDAGELRPLNRRLVRREASKTDLIVVRAEAAAERLRAWGVNAPIEVTADNALTFQPDPADADILYRLWPEAAAPIVGICPVNFHLWPVVVRPWGKKDDCYRWPYYFSHSPERTRAAADLAAGYATLADDLVARHGAAIALIAMEQLDEPIARQIHERMAHPDQARLFSSREYDASQMTSLLRSLDLLVTSRYHAAILSLAAQTPQVAVGHDLRLKSLYQELGLHDSFFLDPHAGDLWCGLRGCVEQLLEHPECVRETLRRGYEEHLAKARRNRELLRAFATSHGWGGAS
jgi:polysaccharide pyruvyl transferase WcaK-like protein